MTTDAAAEAPAQRRPNSARRLGRRLGRHSLAARLYVSLLGVVLLIALLQGGAAFRSALMSADDLFDYHMQQMALSLQSNRSVVEQDSLPWPSATGLPPAGLPELPGGLSDHFDYVVQIRSGQGVQIFHSGARAALPTHEVLGFSNVSSNGRQFRVFSLRSGDRIVQVAQDLSARRSQALKLALNAVLPVLLTVPLLLLVMGWVVRRSLRPVQVIRAQVAARQAHALDPVDESDLPIEIRPLVAEMNALLGRVRQAFDAQRHFVADAAHELRSPLTALRLQVQSLQRASDPAARQQAEERLLVGIDRATHLVAQLLELARRQAGSADAHSANAPVDLAETARRVIGAESGRAAAANIDLGFVHDEAGHAAAPVVQGHAQALSILLRNLVDNAIKYTPSGGRVDVGLLSGSGWFVEDSGPGIPVAERMAVFERFRRGTAASSPQGRQVDGSGLGLAIVQAIADQNGATVILSQGQRLGGLRVEVRFNAATVPRAGTTSAA